MPAHLLKSKSVRGHLDDSVIRQVLVVDDSRAQRRVLVATLTRLGFDVIEAESGEEALLILGSTHIDLVLSDWMMPGMTGLELCRQFRKMPRDQYGYFILLTSKNEKGAVARGLDIGADDFLTKPISPDELRARISAGDRILRMERELNEKNRLVIATLDEISTLYDALDRDLVEARKMQMSLVKDKLRDFGQSQVSLLLKPSGHVGGDLVGCFDGGNGTVAIYAIDVSGHGIASALLTARIAGYLTDGTPARNVAFEAVPGQGFRMRPPDQVAQTLNELMVSELKSDLYFTMTLAYVDQGTGDVQIAQCGHPNPAVIASDGAVRFHGTGGLPIGLVTDATYETHRFKIAPGERLVLYSDGFTECRDAADEELEEGGLAQLLTKNASLRGGEFFEALTWDLDRFADGQAMPDDISSVVLDYRGSAPDKKSAKKT
ncbi:sigma-B regulation protein RsbU (phosphoserine phosphatase) [Maritimibacter alkaliphilus HTCC2654]|uniref:Response regulator n=1 Tax=Maritimibacter alkaliphilus HTCC2654 TaxID=314271 RepID=A3VGC3_9RHOB|nr:fused response regulator/phosphatase [Maritimibacter alkaliphilus]EAQ12328.1 response regulator [Rhodobacterales bacterium HTCC2654] [Maritimibacter alkaliphilus HTCC2654]TYP84305.1 sigma-B regulation protein RsbU (phosphoserine phosphatase) [Maritimibacter alkaliphilus HTCC2654]